MSIKYLIGREINVNVININESSLGCIIASNMDCEHSLPLGYGHPHWPSLQCNSLLNDSLNYLILQNLWIIPKP